jgi:hypothetical protein
MIWVAAVLGSVGAGWLLGRGDAAVNLQAAADSSAEPLLLGLLGVTFGLYGRDRIRLRRSWPSPSLAYAGKFLFVGAFAPALTFVLAPVDWPVAWLTGFAAGCAGGVACWLGNLPLRM